MTSERYLCRDSERISWRKVVIVVTVIAVRRRLMNAVFFFSEESRDPLVRKTSGHASTLYRTTARVGAYLPFSPAHVLRLMSRSSPFQQHVSLALLKDVHSSRFLLRSMRFRAVSGKWFDTIWFNLKSISLKDLSCEQEGAWSCYDIDTA